MDRMWMRGWKQHGYEERSTRSYSVCETTVRTHSPQIQINTHTQMSPLFTLVGFSYLSLSGAGQIGAGAAGQAVLWPTTAGAQEETPGPEAQGGEAARCCGGKAQADTEGGESEFWRRTSQMFPSAGRFRSSGGCVTSPPKLVSLKTRSDMNLQCVGRWRRAKGPSTAWATTREEGNSPRAVTRTNGAFLNQ